MMGRLLNFAMFYLGWVACVVGAAHGEFWLGPSVVAALVLTHLSLTPRAVQETWLILAIGLFGFVIDTVQASAGLYAFTRTSPAVWLCPLWMVALWMVFATTLNSSMAWLAGRSRLAAVLGAICGPVSYVAGARLGAIDLPAHVGMSLLGIAIVWACVMPTLFWLRNRLTTAAPRFRLLNPVRAL
jgi:uncharacterized protein DUF2878